MRDPFATVPTCPMCDGPCLEDFERSDHRFPDRLRTADSPDTAATPRTAPRSAHRGRRPHTSSQDRMRRLETHRAHTSEGDG